MEELWEMHASAKSNMAATGHLHWSSANAWPIVVILGPIIRFSRVISSSVKYFVTMPTFNQIVAGVNQKSACSLQINVIRQQLTKTTTTHNNIHTICYS